MIGLLDDDGVFLFHPLVVDRQSFLFVGHKLVRALAVGLQKTLDDVAILFEKERRVAMTFMGKAAALRSVIEQELRSPCATASPVSGGARNVASRPPLERAMRRLAAGPLASKVTDLPRDVPLFDANIIEISWAPPKATMPTFLPIKSAGLVIFFCATRLKGNLFSDAEIKTRSASLIDGGNQGGPVDLTKVGASS